MHVRRCTLRALARNLPSFAERWHVLGRALWPLYWLAQGTMFWALFVVGHDWCAVPDAMTCCPRYFVGSFRVFWCLI